MGKLIRSLLLTPIIVLVLASEFLFLGWENFHRSFQRARDAACTQDALIIQNAANQFTFDKQRKPKSLQELVDTNYLLAVPSVPCQAEPGLIPVLGDPIPSPHLTATRQSRVN
jgi:competence protein ComGC